MATLGIRDPGDRPYVKLRAVGQSKTSLLPRVPTDNYGFRSFFRPNILETLIIVFARPRRSYGVRSFSTLFARHGTVTSGGVLTEEFFGDKPSFPNVF